MKDIELEDLYDIVCLYYGIEGLAGNSGENTPLLKRARKSFIYLAREYTPASNGEIAHCLIDITANGVSRHYARMKRELGGNRKLEATYNEELFQIISHVRG